MPEEQQTPDAAPPKAGVRSRRCPSRPTRRLGVIIAALLVLQLGNPVHLMALDILRTNANFYPEILQILRESPLIDGHNDLPWQYRKRFNDDISKLDLRADTSKLSPPMVTDIARLRAGGMGAQFWSVYIPVTLNGSLAIRAVLEQIDVVHQFVRRYPDVFELANSADDLERIHRSGRIASLIGMEGGHSIDNSLAMLRMTYALGARYMTLTHMKNTAWADSANDTPQHHGLTPFGEEVVREMNQLGMLVDLSHVSEETMKAALQASQAPIIFSHSSTRALCNDPRNVPDDILKMVPANGGVVMITFFPQYLTERARAHWVLKKQERTRLEQEHPDQPDLVKQELEAWDQANPLPHAATISDVADHIDHVRKICGLDHVGLGGDFEGFDGPPDGLEDVSCYPALLTELTKRGYNREEIKQVAGSNLVRVLRQAEKVAAKLRTARK